MRPTTYNLLPKVLKEAKKVGADVVAINDASTDDSLRCLTSYGISTLTHPCQMGYGVTIQTGYKYALANHYDYLIQIDGDGQHDPRCVSLILAKLTRSAADVVIGSRFMSKAKMPFHPRESLYHGTPIRRIGIYLFRFILLCLSFRKITDPTSGFIGFNRRVLHFMCGKGFPFDYPDADVVLTLLRNDFALLEIPVYMYPKTKRYGLHRGCKPIWYVIKVSISLVIAFLRDKEVCDG